MSKVIGGRFFPSSLKGLQATAGEIDSVVSPDPKLAKIHKLFRDAAYGVNTNVKYIVTGDSTRDRTANRFVLDYYVSMLAQIGVIVYDNADASQSALDWQNNTDQNTLQEAIDNSSGTDGEYTILEYSLGLNDYSNYIATHTEAEIKGYIKNGVIAYQTAKPKASVILVKPPRTDAIARTAFLDTCYNEIAQELNLFMVDAYIPTADIVAQIPTWYDDGTHPNRFGSTRIGNYVMDKIIPFDLKGSKFFFQEWAQPDSLVTNLLANVNYLQGYYQTTTNKGIWTAQTRWRSTEKFPVDDRFSFNITWVASNRTEIYFYDENDAFLSDLYADGKIPRGAKTCALNLYVGADAAAATAWETTYKSQQLFQYVANSYKPTQVINDALDVDTPLQHFRNGKLIDYYGFTGEVGESLKIDANGKMKWSV